MMKYLNITFTDGNLQTIAITGQLDFDDEGAFIKFYDGEEIYSFRAEKVDSWELVVEGEE